MSSVESLLCNSCGAPLDVPKSANYIKCNHCHTQLHINRGDSVTFTESIAQLNETTESLRDQVTQLTKQQRLADLDRQWEMNREGFMVTGKNGHRSLPSEGTAVFGGVFITLFGLFWTVMACGITSNSPFPMARVFPLFGVLFVAGGIYTTIQMSGKATSYKTALQNYERERAAVIEGQESAPTGRKQESTQ